MVFVVASLNGGFIITVRTLSTAASLVISRKGRINRDRKRATRFVKNNDVRMRIHNCQWDHISGAKKSEDG